MTWQHKEKCVRGVWEGRCAVADCGEITRLEGGWTVYPKTPRFFHMTSGRNGELANGWLYFHRGWLAYNAEPKVYMDSMVLCPDHAPAWQVYCNQMDDWNKAVRVERKTWWATLTALFRPAPPAHPPMPPSPFRTEVA